jgi:hypothetical protein
MTRLLRAAPALIFAAWAPTGPAGTAASVQTASFIRLIDLDKDAGPRWVRAGPRCGLSRP